MFRKNHHATVDTINLCRAYATVRSKLSTIFRYTAFFVVFFSEVFCVLDLWVMKNSHILRGANSRETSKYSSRRAAWVSRCFQVHLWVKTPLRFFAGEIYSLMWLCWRFGYCTSVEIFDCNQMKEVTLLLVALLWLGYAQSPQDITDLVTFSQPCGAFRAARR